MPNKRAKARRAPVVYHRQQTATDLLPPEVSAAREALLLPFSDEHADSQRRAMSTAVEPRALAGFIRWVRWAYQQEPPIRLHNRDVADDGTPHWTGDFLAWVAGGTASCGTNEEGYLRTPLRCAIYTMHGRFERSPSAQMADFVLSVAATDRSVTEVARAHGIRAHWAQPIAAETALRRLWALYTPMLPT